MKTRIWPAIAIVFVSALVIGFFAGQQFEHHHVYRILRGGPHNYEQALMARLTKGLELSAEQVPLVREKVKIAAQASEQSCREQRALMRERMVGLLKDIRPLLNEKQQRVLDELDVDILRPRHRDAKAPSAVRPSTADR